MTGAEEIQYQGGMAAFWGQFKENQATAPILPEGEHSNLWRAGWESAKQTRMFVPPDTPKWVFEFLATTPHGGWIHPIRLTPDHPLIAQEWSCFHCEQALEAVGYAILMPFSASEGSRWVVYHRNCSMELMGLPRPIDARLGKWVVWTDESNDPTDYILTRPDGSKIAQLHNYTDTGQPQEWDWWVKGPDGEKAATGKTVGYGPTLAVAREHLTAAWPKELWGG